MVLKKIIKNAKHLFLNCCLSEKCVCIYFDKNVSVFFKASDYVMKDQGSDYGAVTASMCCVSYYRSTVIIPTQPVCFMYSFVKLACFSCSCDIICVLRATFDC